MGARKEDYAQLAKGEKKADIDGIELMKTKQLGTLFVDRVAVLSVSKQDTLSTAFEVLRLGGFFVSLCVVDLSAPDLLRARVEHLKACL